MRAELAGVCSELTATHAAAQTEKHHAAHRLADQQAHYEELIRDYAHGYSSAPTPPPPRVSQDDR